MDVLVFQLRAPLSSWGEPAVGEFRGSTAHPTQSAILGLLGAALGRQRDDDAAHAALRDELGFAVGLLDDGRLLRDYQTAQVPPRSVLKGRPRVTRRDELSVPRTDLSTVLSTRDYRSDAASLVALVARPPAPPTRLAELAAALRMPRYPLYLGRKSCPPSAPLWPQIVQADDAVGAFHAYAQALDAAIAAAGNRIERLPAVQRVYVDEHMPAGAPISLSVPRKDRLVRRSKWQFGDRVEHLALLSNEG